MFSHQTGICCTNIASQLYSLWRKNSEPGQVISCEEVAYSDWRLRGRLCAKNGKAISPVTFSPVVFCSSFSWNLLKKFFSSAGKCELHRKCCDVKWNRFFGSIIFLLFPPGWSQNLANKKWNEQGKKQLQSSVICVACSWEKDVVSAFLRVRIQAENKCELQHSSRPYQHTAASIPRCNIFGKGTAISICSANSCPDSNTLDFLLHWWWCISTQWPYEVVIRSCWSPLPAFVGPALRNNCSVDFIRSASSSAEA